MRKTRLSLTTVGHHYHHRRQRPLRRYDAFRPSRQPQVPHPTIWQCHSCGNAYRLSATVRCLRCHNHQFCGNTERETPQPPSKRRHQPCRIIYFDYVGWEVWNAWRREWEIRDAFNAQRDDLARRRTLYKRLRLSPAAQTARHGLRWRRFTRRRLRIEAKERNGRMCTTLMADIESREDRLQDRRRTNCARDCDWFGNCHHEQEFAELDMDMRELSAESIYLAPAAFGYHYGSVSDQGSAEQQCQSDSEATAEEPILNEYLSNDGMECDSPNYTYGRQPHLDLSYRTLHRESAENFQRDGYDPAWPVPPNHHYAALSNPRDAPRAPQVLDAHISREAAELLHTPDYAEHMLPVGFGVTNPEMYDGLFEDDDGEEYVYPMRRHEESIAQSPRSPISDSDDESIEISISSMSDDDMLDSPSSPLSDGDLE